MRFFNLEDYGLFVLLTSLTLFISYIIFPEYLSFQKFIPEYKRLNKKNNLKLLINCTFYRLIKHSIILWLLFTIFVLVIDTFLTNNYFLFIFISSFLIPITSIKNYISQLLISNENLKIFALLSLINACVYLLFAVLIIFLKLDLFWLFSIKIISDGIFISLGIFLANKLYRLYPTTNYKLFNDRRVIKEYTYPLYKSSLVNIFYSEGSKLMVGSLVSLEGLSLYNLARLFLDNITNVFYAIPNSLFPYIQRKLKDEDKVNFIVNSFKFCTYFSFLSLLIIYLYGKEFINFFMDEKYVASFNLLLILSTQILFRWPSNIFGLILNMRNKTIFFYKVSFYKFIIDFILMFVLIYFSGVNGVAYANVLGYFAASLLISFFAAKEINMNFLAILKFYIYPFLIFICFILYK